MALIIKTSTRSNSAELSELQQPMCYLKTCTKPATLQPGHLRLPAHGPRAGTVPKKHKQVVKDNSHYQTKSQEKSISFWLVPAAGAKRLGWRCPEPGVSACQGPGVQPEGSRQLLDTCKYFVQLQEIQSEALEQIPVQQRSVSRSVHKRCPIFYPRRLKTCCSRTAVSTPNHGNASFPSLKSLSRLKHRGSKP